MAGQWDLGIARTIVDTGMSLGASETQILAALSAALVESGMRNVAHGDRDSLGVFQQRPSMAWGTPQQVQDVSYAARAFYAGAGTNKGALSYADWSGTPGQLAQQVQRSAYPERYDQRIDEARQILNALRSGQGQQGGEQAAWQPAPREAFDPQQMVNAVLSSLSEQVRSGGIGARIPGLDEDLNATRAPGGVERAGTPDWWRPSPNDPVADDAMSLLSEQMRMDLEEIRRAMEQPGDLGFPHLDAEARPGLQPGSQAQRFIELASEHIGTPYKWGGAAPGGFDCSGLIQYVARQLGITVPRVSADQAKVGQAVGSLDAAQPGDLIAFAARGKAVGHIGIYLGNGQMLHSPRTGKNVEVATLGDYWTGRIATIRRIFDLAGTAAPGPMPAPDRAAAPPPRRSSLPSTSRTAGSSATQWKGRV